MFEEIKPGIYRIFIPFENIYTTSFILAEKNKAIILDSGSNDDDAKQYIIPTVERLGVTVEHLVSTHSHGDHAGGIEILKETYKNASAIFSDGELLLERFKIISLPGHSPDSIGVLDLKTNTLISGDSLQLAGVGRYGTSVSDLKAYRETIKKVSDMNLKTIIASHDYLPLGSIAEGENIEEYLNECVIAVERIQSFFQKNKYENIESFVSDFGLKYPDLPSLIPDIIKEWF